MLKRLDVHKPSAIEPSDYVFVGHECVKIEDLGSALFAQEERAKIKAHMAHTGGHYSDHEHGGNCMVCGSVNAIYTVLFHHVPSNTYVRMGSDCTENMFHDDFGASIFKQRAADARLALAGQKKAQMLLADAGFIAAWEIYAAVNGNGYGQPYEEATIIDIVSKLVKYGSVSEKSMNYVGVLLNKLVNKPAIEAAKADVPVGRINITGTVVTTKVKGSAYGSILKMLVKSDAGWKVWGMVPSIIDPKRGDVVSFTATVERSKDDPKFGFFKRPTGAKVVDNNPFAGKVCDTGFQLPPEVEMV